MAKETKEMAEDRVYVTENEGSIPVDDQEALHKEPGVDLNEIEGSNDFMELYEQSLKSIQEGEIVKGEIVQVGKEYVLVDIGYKSEGQVRINEFIDSEGNLTVKVGEKVDVLLERREDDDGRIILSKEKVVKIKIWDEIKEVYEKDGTIRGKILCSLKRGMAVDIGLQAFLPASQIDLKPIRNLNSLIGTVHDFKILKYNKLQESIILSRRAILEAERKVSREEALRSLKDGAVWEGTVNNIKNYGAFVEIEEGVEGLIHLSEMSWTRKIRHPSKVLNIGDIADVLVLNIDVAKRRINLSLKQVDANPWDEIPEKYKRGTKVTGKVTNVTDFGVFIELEEGIEGLIHLSEISRERWGKALLRFHVDDVIQAVVINVSRDEKRISLSVRKLDEGTEEDIYKNYVNKRSQARHNMREISKEEMIDLREQTSSERKESVQHEAVQSDSDNLREWVNK